MTLPAIDIPDVIQTSRSDPIYNCHGYLTKVPVGAIKPFVEAFSLDGDIVVDPFAGSGMTGIAAAAVGRNAVLSDISELGRHIATGYLQWVEPTEFLQEASDVVRLARSVIEPMYTTIRESDGEPCEMVRTIWSFVYECPECQEPTNYYSALLTNDHHIPKTCACCGGPFARRSWPRLPDIPVLMVIKGQDGKLTEQPIQDVDLKMIDRAEKDARLSEVPSLTIERDREMFSRSGLGRSGLTETAKFFSARNAIALLELWKAIDRVSTDSLRKKLAFAFTAILPRASRRYQWGPKRPLNAQNQTYYVAPVFYEWNVFDLYLRKVRAVIRSDDSLFRSTPLLTGMPEKRVRYEIKSADDLSHLQDESVDYVFTDPPFGSNIFYSDMNLFHEAWLGEVTDPSREAVVHTTGKRKSSAADKYEELLGSAFSELHRVLKKGRYMSVVFGNSSGAIWALVLRALKQAGFAPVPAHVAILDKGQRSVKGLNSGSESVVTVDLVMTLQKTVANEPEAPRSRVLRQEELADLVGDAMSELHPEHAQNPSYVYAATLRQAIGRNVSVEGIHLSDVLIQLRNSGHRIDSRTGLISKT